MVRAAKPADGQRIFVAVVMCFAFGVAADLAGKPFKRSCLQSAVNDSVRPSCVRMGAFPFLDGTAVS